jgi:hypothetical protein
VVQPFAVRSGSVAVFFRPFEPDFKTLVTACKGHAINFPDGKSPHTAYPFALHKTLVLPRDYIVKNGAMKLFAQSCTGLSEGEIEKCQPCRQLMTNAILDSIFTRIADSIHENT